MWVASFRLSGQVLALAGCDLLTISPALLAELEAQNGTVEARLNPERAKNSQAPWMPNNEVVFRTELNNDAMATEKLAEEIGRASCRERVWITEGEECAEE